MFDVKSSEFVHVHIEKLLIVDPSYFILYKMKIQKTIFSIERGLVLTTKNVDEEIGALNIQ